MFKKNLFKNIFSEKGISILIVFFVMVIILAVVLGINVIILSEMKITREIGYSVISFYAGDTGLEKTLYYDRKIIPSGGTRGICDICNSCSDCGVDCAKDGIDCDPTTCTDCQITYISQLNQQPNIRSFKVVSTISPVSDTFQSYGSYMDISRAVELSGGTKSSPCGGYFSNGHCWYAGGYNQSCNDVCTDKGGVADSENASYDCVWTDSGCTVLHLLTDKTCSYCYSSCPIFYYDPSYCFSCEDKSWGDCNYKNPAAILICACKN